jgi:hypothetical protein
MKLSRRDKVVTAILLILIALLSYLMHCHWRNRFGSRGEAKPVGEVEYKYHQVQRKYSDRMIWEDVESRSPIYAYDWVMTKDKSDARITLNNGMKVDMDPESMVEIDETRDGVGLTLRDGTIRADSRSAKGASITAADGTKIDLDKANAQITSDGAGVSVDVKEGSATVKNRDQKTTVGAGEIGNVSQKGVTKEKTSIVLKSPAVGAVLDDPTKPVEFSFNAPADAESCVILLNTPGKPRRTITVTGGTHSEKLGDGSYQWRVSCRAKGNVITSSGGAFRMRPQQSFALLSPSPGQVVTADNAESLRLAWRSSGPVHVDVSKDSDFASLVQSNDSTGQSASVKNLKPGKYYWRVYPAGNKSAALQSSFTVSDKGELLAESDAANAQKNAENAAKKKAADEAAARKQQSEKSSGSIKITARGAASLTLEPDAKSGRFSASWSPVNKNYRYRLRVASDERLTEDLKTQTVKGKGSATVALSEGEFFYRVDVLPANGTRPLASSTLKSVTVKRKRLPPPPKVKSVQAE